VSPGTISVGKYRTIDVFSPTNVVCSSYLAFSKAVWNGMPTVYKEAPKEVINTCADPEVDVEGLLVEQFDVKAGIALTDPQDPRYQQLVRLRTRFGNLVHLAAAKLRQSQGEEDHIDAVIAVVKAIDTFFLDYGMSRGDFATLQKNFVQSRECVLFFKMWWRWRLSHLYPG
jgi:proteasome activator subunit 4